MPVLARFYGIVIREWIGLHQDALVEMWETQEFRKLDPLD